MKHIKSLRLFESTQELTEDQINFLNSYTDGKWRVNPNTGLVDVEGNFDCFFEGIPSFKGVKFGAVRGSFRCSDNSLTSLKGAPKKVGGCFDCSNSALSSLKGAPKEVGGVFYCSYNSLTSLEGAPKEVGESFYCSNNSLTSLEGSPQEVGGVFFCSNNSLTSLEGAPKEVGEVFDCSYNSLTSLEGAPQEVGRGFKCDTFKLKESEWNPQGWVKILKEGSKEAKKLILTLPFLDPNYIKNEIKKNPGKWVMDLKGVWNSEEFRPLRDKLKVSDQFLKDIGDQSTLSDLGF